MSRIFKCDRCGAIFNRLPADRACYIPPKSRIPAELCPACTNRLKIWFEDVTAAESIVRCGECKHLMPNGYCTVFADRDVCPSVSDFCSYGERRNEGDPE